MLASAERACLVIADISGYTGYLAETEIDHAQDILADLMETIIGPMQPILRLNKLEGDAIFTYAPQGEIDGSILMDILDNAYFAFQRRLRSIRQATTCQCNACRTIPALNVKFCVHNGDFVRQRILGREELAGRDVILVHRLLKNSVSETLGLHGYAIFSDGCLEAMKIDPAALGMIAHQETYEHIGAVNTHVYDLQARWTQEEATRRIFLPPAEADARYEEVFSIPQPLMWEWATDASRRTQWAESVTRVDVSTVGGRRGIGTTNHCMHGPEGHIEEIVDWRPFDYYSYIVRDFHGMGEVLATESLEPTDGGTRYVFAIRFHSPQMRAAFDDPERHPVTKEVLGMFNEFFATGFVRLKEILAEQLAERQEDIALAEATRKQLQATAAHYWESREAWVAQPSASP